MKSAQEIDLPMTLDEKDIILTKMVPFTISHGKMFIPDTIDPTIAFMWKHRDWTTELDFSPQQIHIVKTFHTFVYSAFFKPDMVEVIRTIPPEFLLYDKIYVNTVYDGLDEKNNLQIGKTTIMI